MRENDRKREGKGEDFRGEMNSRTRGNRENNRENTGNPIIVPGNHFRAFLIRANDAREIIPADFSENKSRA